MASSENLKKAFEYHKNNKLDEAESYYKKALLENDKDSRIYDYLGTLFFQRKDYLNAEKNFKKAFSISKDDFLADNLGKIYIKEKKFDEAIEILRQGIDINNKNDSLWFDLGLAYRSKNNFSEAKKAYQKSVELNSKLSEAYFNLAYLHFNDNEPLEAVKCYEKVLELSPNESDTMYFLSLAYMQTKNYDKGLKYFESRLCRASSFLSQNKTYPNYATQKNFWQGEDISDKTIYTYYEAGFGDVIMFARYLPNLKKRCKKVICKPQSQLVTLFEENFPDIEFHTYFKSEKDVQFDVHIPILSLPYIMKLKGEELFTGHEGYLKANPDKIKRFKEIYFNNDKFKIGIKWQGNTFYDTERVIKIQNFFRIMGIENTQFYSCQTGDGSEEYNKIPTEFNVINMSNAFEDFSETAAAVSNMDLVICNDTSLAHIAGAMNKPCWVLLPHVYNWRWHTDLSKCDWYDSIKIFRQNNQGDWDGVFDNVEKELSNIIL